MADVLELDGLGYVLAKNVWHKPTTPKTDFDAMMKKSLKDSVTPAYRPPATSGYAPTKGIMVETTPENDVTSVIGQEGQYEMTSIPSFSAQPKLPSASAAASKATPFAPIKMAPEGKPYAPQIGPVTPEQLVNAAQNEPMAEEETPAGDFAPATASTPLTPAAEAAAEALTTAQAVAEEAQKKTPWLLYGGVAVFLAYLLFRKKG